MSTAASEPTRDPDELMFLAMGQRIRDIRTAAGLTIRTLANRTGLSSSMLSMVERGNAKPSVGSLVAIASALDVQTGDLFSDQPGNRDPVSRRASQSVIDGGSGVRRRLVRSDRTRGVEISTHEYGPGAETDRHEHQHGGYEYGVVLEGCLEVELGDESYSLAPGDSIGFASSTPHRMLNSSTERATAVWVNIDH